MNKFNIFLANYGLIIFFVSLLLLVTFVGEINSKFFSTFLLILIPIYAIFGTIYLGNNLCDYIELENKKK